MARDDEATLEAIVLAQLEGWPPVVVRVYVAQPEEAALDFAEEARIFAANGYLPVSQVWAPGTWDSVVVAVAVIFSLAAIGLPFLAYMLVATPDETLTVVYRPSAAAASP